MHICAAIRRLNEDFTAEVQVSDIVVWRGEGIPSNSSIELHSINYQGGANLLDRNVINDSNGIVSAEVIQGQPDDVEKLYSKV